jgi:hypothetical protein
MSPASSSPGSDSLPQLRELPEEIIRELGSLLALFGAIPGAGQDFPTLAIEMVPAGEAGKPRVGCDDICGTFSA